MDTSCPTMQYTTEMEELLSLEITETIFDICFLLHFRKHKRKYYYLVKTVNRWSISCVISNEQNVIKYIKVVEVGCSDGVNFLALVFIVALGHSCLPSSCWAIMKKNSWHIWDPRMLTHTYTHTHIPNSIRVKKICLSIASFVFLWQSVCD